MVIADWADIIPADKAIAATYWGNDNPPLELQAAFASHRRATEQRIEEQFWTIVDGGGLASVPSDMFAALEVLKTSAKRSA